MENQKPQMNTLQVGEQFKVLEVIGVPNSDMPLHYCTSEAVLIIHVGRAILTMDNFEKEMKLGMSVIIPAKKEHSLKIIDSVKAYVVIARDATIEFAQ
ncbi:MAG: cupin [Algicola sp.]|nr:cupin [Algicola sp.]